MFISGTLFFFLPILNIQFSQLDCAKDFRRKGFIQAAVNTVSITLKPIWYKTTGITIKNVKAK